MKAHVTLGLAIIGTGLGIFCLLKLNSLSKQLIDKTKSLDKKVATTDAKASDAKAKVDELKNV